MERKKRTTEELFQDLKRQKELRDRMNVLPEDITKIYGYRKDFRGRDVVCAREENGWRLAPLFTTKYHRYPDGVQGIEALYNRKFMHRDENGGSREAVICFPPGKLPYLVTDTINCGTYNFVDPECCAFPLTSFKRAWGHFRRDMLPYFYECRLREKAKKEEKEKELTGGGDHASEN